MPPSLALAFWVILLVVLFRYDAAQEAGTSPALWVPLIWLFIVASRLPAQWMSGGGGGLGNASFEEGNPIDRSIFFILILIAMAVLVSRSFQWNRFFASNLVLIAFVVFSLLSILWSDFPLIALKRWFRDLGNYLVVLVVLSDRRPLKAVCLLLRRVSFALISLSVLLIKYYPGIGVGWDTWTGVAAYTGATTSKYMLAVVCMVAGIYFFWDAVTRWPNRRTSQTRRILYTDAIFIAMTLWVLNLANGKTCQVCMVIAWLVILAANTATIKRHPAPLKVLVPIIACLSLFLVFGADYKADIATAVGRDPTFTDRTQLWSYLLGMNIDPLLGTGYESFWLGPRLLDLWGKFTFRPTQAHNGYLEIYLNLGMIGLALVIAYLIAAYRTICEQFTAAASFTPFRLALWTILPICSITTAAFFKGDLLWLAFLLGSITVPNRAQNVVPDQHDRGRTKQIVAANKWDTPVLSERTWG